jgi:AraC-like DNA-binding protein
MVTHEIYYYRDFMEATFPFKLAFPNERTLNVRLHAHEHFQICYVMRGSCVHHVNQRTYVIAKGDLLAVPPFEPHRFTPSETEEVAMVQIDFMPVVVGPNELLHQNPLFPRIQVSADNQRRIEQLIADMQQEHAAREAGYEELIKADLIRLLVTLFRESSRDTELPKPQAEQQNRRLFHETVDYIERHYTEELHLDEMAGRAAMSPTYFSYIFKVLKGQTFVQYVNDLRIRRALDLLRLTDKSIYEICFETGFNNISHFNRVFRKITGTSPMKYRGG